MGERFWFLSLVAQVVEQRHLSIYTRTYYWACLVWSTTHNAGSGNHYELDMITRNVFKVCVSVMFVFLWCVYTIASLRLQPFYARG